MVLGLCLPLLTPLCCRSGRMRWTVDLWARIGQFCLPVPAILDEGDKIRFQAGAVLIRMSQEQIDQPSLSCSKMPGHTPPGESMQQRDGLFSQQTFKFFGRHLPSLFVFNCSCFQILHFIIPNS
jgi:hypothetical protein